MEPAELVGRDLLEKAYELYKDFQIQFKNVRWITLSKFGKFGYEQQKRYDLKDGEEF